MNEGLVYQQVLEGAARQQSSPVSSKPKSGVLVYKVSVCGVGSKLMSG